MAKKKLHRIILRNDWERDIYEVEGITINGRNPPREIVLVRSGQQETVPASAEAVSVPYSDHGHTYTSTSTHLFVHIPFLGTHLDIDLRDVIARSGRPRVGQFLAYVTAEYFEKVNRA